MDGYRVEVKVRNNLLLDAMERSGIESGAELARLSGVSYSAIVNFLNFKLPPFNQFTGEYRDAAVDLAVFLKCLPDDLFPKEVRDKAIQSNKREFALSSDGVRELFSGGRLESLGPEVRMQVLEAKQSIIAAVKTLSPKEAFVIQHHIVSDEKKSFAEIGKLLHSAGLTKTEVTGGRVSQIEWRALAKLRHPRNELHEHMRVLARSE